MSDSTVSQQQLQVITALSEGMNSTGAAAQAGVHRNTIAYWRRNSLPFREALAHAQYDRALLFREKAEEMVDLACQTLRNLMDDPKTSASVRLKAAIFIIGMAATPPPRKEHVPFDIEKLPVSHAPAVTTDPNGHVVHETHKDAQSAPAPFRREAPKVGRNDPCPCGSGRKYKICCLNKPQPDARAQAA
jgi:hypothetical protein